MAPDSTKVCGDLVGGHAALADSDADVCAGGEVDEGDAQAVLAAPTGECRPDEISVLPAVDTGAR